MKERRISIIYDETGYTLTWLKTLLCTKNLFRYYGYRIEFVDFSNYRCNSLSHKKSHEYYKKIFKYKKYDIVLLAFHHSTSLFNKLPYEIRIELLKMIKGNCNLLVWLDTADSTGTCNFEVLPIVDFYLKKQILKDISRYEAPIWGGRTFCEFYHERYNLDDESIADTALTPLDSKYMDKIRLSWNVGLGDLFTHSKLKKYVYQNKCFVPEFISPYKDRVFDVHYRGSHKFPVVHYQRIKTTELLDNTKNLNFPEYKTKVPYARYINELKNTKSIISPFGWGEICTRDFEAFAFGATLLKHDMEHLYTFPQWYIKNETYVSIDWDFKNFPNVLENIIKNQKEYINIAVNGQELLKKYRLGEAWKKEFVLHLLKNIELV